MGWQNDDLVLYHGCTTRSLHPTNPKGIKLNQLAHGIDPKVGSRSTDFGPGFYATSSLHQAKCWADLRQVRQHRKYPGTRAVVLSFQLKRNDFAELDALVFVTETTGFWPFVSYCRALQPPHGRLNCKQALYDVVTGPLSAGRQQLIYKDCDQIGFHTDAAVKKIQTLTLAAIGSPRFM